MTQTYARRFRRSSPSTKEAAVAKKDNQHEHTFFGAPSHESFFKPNTAIQRKCDHCEAEEKKANRMDGEKEEEKKIRKMGEKKEEDTVQREPDKKEEDKLMRATDTEEEEKKLQREPGKKEEEKLMRVTDTKEEEKKLQREPGKKEEDKEPHRMDEQKQEEKVIAKKESASSAPGQDTATTGSYIKSLSSKGNALPDDAKEFFGERMGNDFGDVKIHTGTEAERSAKEVNAKAYTVDNNIVFNKDQYNTSSRDGKKLLAHELTHVVQQRGDAGFSKKVQKVPAPGATLDSLSVLNATPVAGVADQFVVPRNSPGGQVIINANVTNPPPGGLDSDALKWKGGTAGTNTQQRLVKVGSSGEFAITATLNGVTNTIRVFIVNTPAAPPAASSALLQHIFSGAANPGGDFGLTVVTIGQQGVKGPEFVINPFLNGDHWEFRVADIKHRYKLGVSSGAGRKDISGPRDADIKPSTVCNVITDLTPPAAGTPSGPPRSIFWSKAITTLHEKAHVDRFYSAPFWEAQMRLFEAFVSGITVPFTSALQSPAAALKDQQVNFKTQADTLHGAADALEIAGAEVAAHGVSNPLYTQLIADITNVAAPPAPTGLNASAVTQNSVTLGWNQDSCIETGFAIERRTNGRGAFVPAGNTATGTLSLTDAGLAADTKLQYRVRATGAGRNSSFSTVINVHTLP